MPLPEYGRNVQNMVDHILTIENREERNKAAQTVINIMGNMYPYLRDIEDFKHKLWDHLAIMANFKLDIDSPYPIPQSDIYSEAPKPVAYNTHRLKFRHYGSVLEQLIEKAATLESGEEQEVLIKMLANHMKKCYLAWNKDVVDDEKIYEDLAILSKGKIQRTDIKLTETRDIINNNRRKKTQFTRPSHNNNKHKRTNTQPK